ncbi:MAG: citrate lyase holo-[acyl-carrier protein] synthase [Synergistaceae bacterium]|jgi:hypothetical protein|nr:citrate lyase holo-[acyl-carrier protein] synthase [Synergistaceae bacterium]
MMSLVRSGPTILKISVSGDAGRLMDALAEMSSNRSADSFDDFYNMAGEGDTLIHIDRDGDTKPLYYQANVTTPAMLCELINKKLCGVIRHIGTTPPNIVMRLIGNLDAAIDQIAADYKAKEATCVYLTNNMEGSSVLLNFTTEPLNRPVPYTSFYKRALLIGKPYGQLLIFLKAKAQEYLNIAMGSPDWNEIEITLFDAMNQFDLHYNRLITVLQGLDVGIVVGEAWVPEYTVAMRKSEVYQVRLLTPILPQQVKRIAMALEYNEAGNRVVDFDVYHKNKKLSWSSELKENKGYTRDKLGTLHRTRLLASLPAEARAMLHKLDSKINN